MISGVEAAKFGAAAGGLSPIAGGAGQYATVLRDDESPSFKTAFQAIGFMRLSLGCCWERQPSKY